MDSSGGRAQKAQSWSQWRGLAAAFATGWAERASSDPADAAKRMLAPLRRRAVRVIVLIAAAAVLGAVFTRGDVLEAMVTWLWIAAAVDIAVGAVAVVWRKTTGR